MFYLVALFEFPERKSKDFNIHIEILMPLPNIL